MILIKAGPSVANVSAFRLSKDVYLVPYYTFNDTNGMASVTLWLRNGSIKFANIKVSGTPTKVVDMAVTYEVEKNVTHYIVRPLSWPVNKLKLWNETFNVTVKLGEPIQIANAPKVEFKNGTYVLPLVCKSTNGGVTVIYIVLPWLSLHRWARWRRFRRESLLPPREDVGQVIQEVSSGFSCFACLVT